MSVEQAVDDALDDARAVVSDFVARHRQAAIPALIGACVGWAMERGAGEVIRKSLTNAIELSNVIEADLKQEMH